MTTTETITVLRAFNRWRRGGYDQQPPRVHEVGEAIDAACEQIEQLEVACQERDQWRECAEVLAKQVQYWMDRESDWGPEDEAAMNIFSSLKGASK